MCELRQVTHLSQTSVFSLVKKIQYGWGEVSVNNALTGQAWGSQVYLPKTTRKVRLCAKHLVPSAEGEESSELLGLVSLSV